MGLARTFVGFSSSDIDHYRLMLAWKAHQHIDFNFIDVQLQNEIKSEDESYIKRKCSDRIDMAGTFISLIGEDTRSKHKYVRWELEVAIEKGCRIIGVNLDGSRTMVTNKTPPVIQDVGALFVSFNAKVVAHALNNFQKKENGSYNYPTEVYTKLGL